MKKRVIIAVLDSFGIGAAPDAADFGDEGADTLAGAARTGKLKIPNLISMGLGCIDGVTSVPAVAAPTASYGRMAELSRGKDTTVGHWELAGIVSERAMPVYENGFPDEIISEFSRAVGRGILCNKPYSGTDVIRDFGDEHVRSGKLIVYTSQDSVFQIAAHESIVPPDMLYEYCRIARGILKGEHAVGRVIARPFSGESGAYVRTAGRRDFSLPPPKLTMLDVIKEQGLDVISVGKIQDIFASCGITSAYKTKSNSDGMRITGELCSSDFHGLLFLNLVDFDMLYGHRQDAVGYAAALSEFDLWLGDFVKTLRADDLLIITADHGCDPTDSSTDHTREYVPLLCYSKSENAVKLGTLQGFFTVAETVCKELNVDCSKIGCERKTV